jgi:SPFH domain / Band 7 family
LFRFIVGVILVLIAVGAGTIGFTVDNRKIRILPAIVFGALGITFMLWPSVRQVKSTDVAVPVKYGKPGAPLDNGLHLVAPWSKLVKFNTKVQDVELKIPITGSDGNALNVNTLTRYRITVGINREGVECSVTDLFESGIRSEEALEKNVVFGGVNQITRDAFRTTTAFLGFTTEQNDLRQKLIIPEVEKRFTDNCVEFREFLIIGAEADPAVQSAAGKAQEAALKAVEAARNAETLAISTKSQNDQREANARTDRVVANEKADGQVEVARKQAEANRTLAESLTPEVLMAQYIDALEKTDNKVIITNGQIPQLTLPADAG